MKHKKLFLAATVLVLAFAMNITAFAASLSTDEQKVITALQENKVPQEYITQATNYFAGNETNLTEAQATTIITEIGTANKIAGSASKLSDMTSSQKQAVVDSLSKAGNELGIKVTFDSSSNKLTAVDTKTGAIVLEAKGNIIATTGINLGASVAVMSALTLALFIAAGFAYKDIKRNKTDVEIERG